MGRMQWFAAPEYWLSRLLVQRLLAALYLIAFLAAARQFRALIGSRGMLPVPRFTARVPFRQAPGLFHLHYSDRFFAASALTGAALSAALLVGLGDAVPLGVSMLCWAVLWVLYLSIVNVGQTWYSFGWESLLLEAGFLAAFLGNADTAPPAPVLWLLRWLVFRVEFGAGLIKLRGDSCWRDLTCLRYHQLLPPQDMPEGKGNPGRWFTGRGRVLRAAGATGHVVGADGRGTALAGVEGLSGAGGGLLGPHGGHVGPVVGAEAADVPTNPLAVVAHRATAPMRTPSGAVMSSRKWGGSGRSTLAAQSSARAMASRLGIMPRRARSAMVFSQRGHPLWA